MPLHGICPIFIVGAPRTGTTLTREILNLHKEIYLYDEVHYNERIVDRLGTNIDFTPEIVRKACSLLIKDLRWLDYESGSAEAVEKMVAAIPGSPVSHSSILQTFLEAEAHHHGKTIWGDSSPQDVLYMDRLKSWYPRARFIALVRDPRAFLASYKNYVRKGVRSYHNRYNPLTTALLWRTYMNALINAEGGEWAGDLLRLKYESLVTNPDQEVKRICTFLDMAYSPEMLNVSRSNSSYHRVDQDYAERGIKSGSVAKWRDILTPAEIWLVERICNQQMITLGYEPEGGRFSPRYLPGLLASGLTLLPRTYNLLFRSRKPLTWNKIRRVVNRL